MQRQITGDDLDQSWASNDTRPPWTHRKEKKKKKRTQNVTTTREPEPI